MKSKDSSSVLNQSSRYGAFINKKLLIIYCCTNAYIVVLIRRASSRWVPQHTFHGETRKNIHMDSPLIWSSGNLIWDFGLYTPCQFFLWHFSNIGSLRCMILAMWSCLHMPGDMLLHGLAQLHRASDEQSIEMNMMWIAYIQMSATSTYTALHSDQSFLSTCRSLGYPQKYPPKTDYTTCLATDKQGIHIIVFLFLNENIYCGYSLEVVLITWIQRRWFCCVFVFPVNSSNI